MRTALVNAVIIGAGGFLGAPARYGLGGLVHRQFPLSIFPFGTPVVNLLGCFAIGVIAGLAESRQLFGPEFRTFALIGILGGFTTRAAADSEGRSSKLWTRDPAASSESSCRPKRRPE